MKRLSFSCIYILISLTISFCSCSNQSKVDKSSTKEGNISFLDKNSFENYPKLSDEEKIQFCKKQLKKSDSIINSKRNISIPNNSIFYIITDINSSLKSKFEKFYTFPIIVRYSDRKVTYSGNRFADGNLNRRDVGRSYDYGSYRHEGWVRDVQIYTVNKETNLFIPSEIGYTTNNLGKYEVYNFEEMKQTRGLPGYLSGMEDVFDYLGNIADEISFKTINLIDNENILFYYNGAFTGTFNGETLNKRVGAISSEKESPNNLDFLKKGKGQYPYEVKLFDNSTFNNRLMKLLGLDRYNFLIETWAVETPIEFAKNIFVAKACQEHNCPSTNFIIVVDFFKNVMYVGIREEGKIKTYSEDGSKSMDVEQWKKDTIL